MRITKDLAFEVSRKMTSKIKEEENRLEEKADKIVSDYYLTQIPQEIIELSKKYPRYFILGDSVFVGENGNHDARYFTLKNIPKSRGREAIELPNELDEELGKLMRKASKIRAERNKLLITIQTTLYDLKTYKKVQELFPEAIEFFPKEAVKSNNYLAVPIKDILSQIEVLEA